MYKQAVKLWNVIIRHDVGQPILETNLFEKWTGYWMKMPDINQIYIEASG